MRARSEPRRAAPHTATRAFQARPAAIPRVVAFVASRARGLPPDKAARLELAVEEWAANVCRHAYREAGGPLEVSVREDATGVAVEMRDEGEPFDPTSAPAPDVNAPLEERTPGGLGVLLIMRMLENVSYRREGRCNIVTFVVGRPA